MSHLFLGLKSIKMKDSSKHRIILFQNYIDSSLLYRLILKNRFIESHFYKKFISNIFALYSQLIALKISLNFNENHQCLAIYEHDNEIRCIKSRISAEQFQSMGAITFSSVFNLSVIWVFLSHIPYSLRLFRICKKLISKKGILIGTRQSQFLVLYSLTHNYFKKNIPGFSKILISTESNPNVIGIALACQKLGKKVIYINHGFLDSQLGLFFHDHLVIQGLALHERIKPFVVNNPEVTDVGAYYKTIPLKIPVKAPKTLGIVLSLNPITERVLTLIDQIVKLHPETKIEIRPHPNHIFSNDLMPILRTHSKIKILEPVNWSQFNPNWDFAIAGNTSAHIDMIAKGIPMIGIDIDENPNDLYGFYMNNYILEASYKTNIEQEINHFYDRSDWKKINQTYLPDASPIFSI